MTLLREYLIDKTDTAAFICDGEKTKYLVPFIGTDCTLAEAATKLNLSKSHMSYWLNQLLNLGLICEQRTEKRGRYQVPIYRAVADVFIVPLEHIPAESDEAILRLSLGDFEDRCVHSTVRCARAYGDGWHVRLKLENGKSWLRILPKDGDTESARILNYWGRLELTPEQATAMRGELRKVFQNYLELSKNTPSSAEKIPYLFRLLLVEEFKNDS
jgi:DNA-binding transcriptional ArsR family regulator